MNEILVAVPETSARYRFDVVQRDGVGVLIVKLEGHVDRDPAEVNALRYALDELAIKLGTAADVSVLDVSFFANAQGDEAGLLTSVFPGLPCCWVTPEWSVQDESGDLRWNVPPLAWLAPSIDVALERVVGWRRAGGFRVPGGEVIWGERGLHVSASNDLDIFYRNLLVERTLGSTRVTWPFYDRTGKSTESIECGARIVYEAGVQIEVDFDPWQTRRDSNPSWLDGIRGFLSLESLVLSDFPATDHQILDALGHFPRLRKLLLDGTQATDRVVKAIIDGAGPSLERLWVGQATADSVEERMAEARPELDIL